MFNIAKMHDIIVAIITFVTIVLAYFLLRKDVYQIMMSELPGKLWLVDNSYYLTFSNFSEQPRVWREGETWSGMGGGGQWSYPAGTVTVTKMDLDKKVIFLKEVRWVDFHQIPMPGVPNKLGMEITDPDGSFIDIILDSYKWFSSPTFLVTTTIRPNSPKSVFGELTNAPMYSK